MRRLSVVGNVNVDLVMGPVAPWPDAGTEVLVEHDDMRVGGAAGNVALAWKAMGVPFVAAANTGADVLGEWLHDTFLPHSSIWSVSARKTTISVGLGHPDGERTFFTTRGHLEDLTMPAVLSTLAGRETGNGLMLLCGSFVTPQLSDDYNDLFDLAAAEHVDIALDTGWPSGGWTVETCKKVNRWLSRTKIALFNEVEAMGLTGAEDVVTAAQLMRSTMVDDAVVVIKRGSEGAMALSDGQFVHVPAPQVAVVDTIGAGDVFNAGFLAALADGRPLDRCVAAGIATASLAISSDPRSYTVDERLPA